MRLLLLVLFAVGAAYGSVGDRLPEFARCQNTCLSSACPDHLENADSYSEHLAWHLRLLGWTCESECHYTCTQYIHQKRLESGERIVQFFGKWPFPRVFGVQEIASVVFSFFNLYFHYQGFYQVRDLVSSRYYMKNTWLFFSAISMNSWLWSVIFHIRDTSFTEKMDYFSATACTVFGVYCVILRYTRFGAGKWGQRISAFVLALYYICHIGYLSSLQRFDYAYNMAANVFFGVLFFGSHFVFCIKKGVFEGDLFSPSGSGGKDNRNPPRKYLHYGIFIFLWLNGSLLLELLDFPPILWGLFDAHSLWHAATIPVSYALYKFTIADCNYEARFKKLSM